MDGGSHGLVGFAVKDGRLCLAGRLSIPVVWSRELPSEPSSVRVYRDSIGHWYARSSLSALDEVHLIAAVDGFVNGVLNAVRPEGRR